MIILVCAVIGIIIFIIAHMVEWGRLCWDNVPDAIMAGGLGAVVGFLILIFVHPMITANTPDEKWETNLVTSVKLVSLSDNYGIEGSTFIFSSYVDNELSYTYMYQTERGLTTKTIDGHDTYIRYLMSNEQPYLKEYEESHPNKLIDWLFCPGSIYYIIFVPEGSVIENHYNIDLQ